MGMLILKRRKDEAIVLNGVIKIYVLAIEGGVVKLGIDAPPDIVVLRSELLDDATHGAAYIAEMGEE